MLLSIDPINSILKKILEVALNPYLSDKNQLAGSQLSRTSEGNWFVFGLIDLKFSPQVCFNDLCIQL